MLFPRIARLRLARLHPDADAAHTARGFHELAKMPMAQWAKLSSNIRQNPWVQVTPTVTIGTPPDPALPAPLSDKVTLSSQGAW